MKPYIVFLENHFRITIHAVTFSLETDSGALEFFNELDEVIAMFKNWDYVIEHSYLEIKLPYTMN